MRCGLGKAITRFSLGASYSIVIARIPKACPHPGMMEDVAEETRKQVELPWYVQARQMTLAPRWEPAELGKNP